MKNYGFISKPLTMLQKKDSFKWSTEADHAFSALKEAMTSTPVLALPRMSVTFVVKTNAFMLAVVIKALDSSAV